MAKSKTPPSVKMAREHGIPQAAARSGAVAVSMKKHGPKKGKC